MAMPLANLVACAQSPQLAGTVTAVSSAKQFMPLIDIHNISHHDHLANERVLLP